MLKRRSSKFLGLLATLALAIVLSACGNSGSGSGSSDDSQTSLGNKEIEIPYIASDNSTPRSLVIAEVLKKAGYDVTTTPVTQVAHYTLYQRTLIHSMHQVSSLLLIKVTTISSKVN